MSKKAFVTGASRGIGRSIALNLAKNGYDVAVTYHTQENEVKSLQKEIQDLGQKCFYYQANMEEADVPEMVTEQAISDLCGIDLLVCNAGLTKHTSILDANTDQIDFVYGLNYRSYVLCTKTAVNHMKNNHVKGSVVYITSTRGIRAYRNDGIYGSLKAALIRAVQSFAIELGEYGINVNAIAPGAIAVRGDFSLKTLSEDPLAKKIPLERRGKPDDIANLAHYLATEAAEYITGETIRVDGGLILYGPNEDESGGYY